jgi:hypothetical protein
MGCSGSASRVVGQLELDALFERLASLVDRQPDVVGEHEPVLAGTEFTRRGGPSWDASRLLPALWSPMSVTAFMHGCYRLAFVLRWRLRERPLRRDKSVAEGVPRPVSTKGMG